MVRVTTSPVVNSPVTLPVMARLAAPASVALMMSSAVTASMRSAVLAGGVMSTT